MLDISLFGLLPVRIRLQMVMLGLEWLVWVVPLSLPSFVIAEFQEFFKLGRALRTTLPTDKGGVIHLFVVYGYQGTEEDSDQLELTDKLLQAVLAEAQVVCGQPLLIAGDLNADPAVIPCLAKGISAGKFVDLALAFSRGAGLAPDATCRFNREEGTAPAATCRFSLEGGAGTRRDFLVGCPNALAASHACYVTDRWFTLSFFSSCSLSQWCLDG